MMNDMTTTAGAKAMEQAIRGNEPKPMRVFHASITYLTLLFVAVGVDPLLPF